MLRIQTLFDCGLKHFNVFDAVFDSAQIVPENLHRQLQPFVVRRPGQRGCRPYEPIMNPVRTYRLNNDKQSERSFDKTDTGISCACV